MNSTERFPHTDQPSKNMKQALVLDPYATLDPYTNP